MGFFKKLFGSFNNQNESNDLSENSNLSIPIEISVRTSFSSSTVQEVKIKEIAQDKDGFWILNPETPFILTAMTSDKSIAEQIRIILDNNNYDGRRYEKLTSILAEHNIKIREIEEYKNKYKKVYLQKIGELIKDSSEWSSLGNKDKEDLMIDFRKIAISEIYEKANCNLEVLFENEPKDVTFDDDLIKEYGFSILLLYIRHAGKMEKVHTISNDHYARGYFEKLVELNLASRGTNILKVDILSTLTLKELNLLAQSSGKEFKRKNLAIEYISGLSNIDEEIGKYISLRELFQLKPLPEKYHSIDIKALSDTWNYHHEEAFLLISTFQNTFYFWRNLHYSRNVREYTVHPQNTENACPCAIALSSKTYPKDTPPRIPYHVGCDCILRQVRNYE